MANLTPTSSVGKKFVRSSGQLRVLQQKGRNRPGQSCDSGVRIDRRWSRDRDALECDERTNLDLANAVAWMHARRGAKMTPSDRDTIAALELRSWSFLECSNNHMRGLPSWLSALVPSRRGRGYAEFLGYVLGAYRCGAAGVLMSYPEGMALARVGSESTWRRWTSELEDLGLVRIMQTWAEDPTGERPRVYGRSLYQLGPKALEIGASAELEGANAGKADFESRTSAIKLRHAQRAEDRAQLGELRDRRSPHDTDAYRPRPRVWRPVDISADAAERDPRFCGVPDDIRTGGDRTVTREIVEGRYREILANSEADDRLAAGAAIASPQKPQIRTPLGDCDNRNALPSFVGGDTTTPPTDGVGTGSQKKGASTANAVDAVGHAEGASLAPSVGTAAALAAMLGRLGMSTKEIHRIAGSQGDAGGGGTSSGHSASMAPRSEVSQPTPSRPATRQGNAAVVPRVSSERAPCESPIAGLVGPLATQLAAFFADRRRDSLDS